jgi:hypothetical protein
MRFQSDSGAVHFLWRRPLIKNGRRATRPISKASSALRDMDELVSSVLGDGGALAEPVDDQIGDLEIVLVHHHHVAVASPAARLDQRS